MTGVLDRLEDRGLLVRTPSPEDGRSWITRLTGKGQALFEVVFPAHIAHLEPLFDDISESEPAKMHTQLRRLREVFEPHTTGENTNGA